MNTFIYRFVQSLELREKIYFSRYTNIHSDRKDKNYLQLYRALEEQDEFDLEQLEKDFAGTIIGKYPSTQVNYLFRQIMNSLVSYHSETSNFRKLTKEIVYIDLLNDRGFKQKGKRILINAKKLAYKYEEFSIILKMIELEERLLFSEGILNFTEQLKKLQTERETINEKIKNSNALRLLREQSRELQFTVGNVVAQDSFNEVFTNPLMASKEQALSKKALDSWYYAKSMFHYYRKEHPEVKAVRVKHLDLLEKSSYIFNPSSQLAIISNALFDAVLMKDFPYFISLLKKIRKLKKDESLNQTYIFYIEMSRLLEYHYRIEKDSIGINKNFAANLKKSCDFVRDSYDDLGVTQRDYLIKLIIRSCIDTLQYSDALEWITFWSNRGYQEYSLRYLRLIKLITYYELGYTRLLDTEIRSCYKILKQKNSYNDLAKMLINFFKRSLKKPQEVVPMQEQLAEELYDFQEREKSKHFLLELDYHRWCTKSIALKTKS